MVDGGLRSAGSGRASTGRLQVPSELAYCLCPDATVFLDIQRDRYFRLPPALETAFRTALCGGEAATAAVERLMALGVLERASDSAQPAHREAAAIAASAVDLGGERTGPGVTTVVWVARSLLKARADLRRGFASALSGLAGRSDRRGVSRDPDAVVAASRTFLSARRLVPIRPVCLLDSLALLDFLGRRNLDADLVFGVIARPFSAHCWLQIGALALNDELENLVGRTPILVV